jgi:hypothetical protein
MLIEHMNKQKFEKKKKKKKKKNKKNKKKKVVYLLCFFMGLSLKDIEAKIFVTLSLK